MGDGVGAKIRALACDISTSCTGWAVMEGKGYRQLGPAELPDLVSYGREERWVRSNDIPYPFGYIQAIQAMGDQLARLVHTVEPDVVVIEETNGGGRAARYTQKMLEWVHLWTLLNVPRGTNIAYVSTSDWRKQLDIRLSAADKKQNAKLSRAKAAGKKLEGVRGKINKKHLAINWVNDNYAGQLLKPLIVKDNDVAEAVCLGAAYFRGVPLSTPFDK